MGFSSWLLANSMSVCVNLSLLKSKIGRPRRYKWSPKVHKAVVSTLSICLPLERLPLLNIFLKRLVVLCWNPACQFSRKHIVYGLGIEANGIHSRKTTRFYVFEPTINVVR